MPDKKLFEKWQIWAALVAGILTIITLSFIIPTQIASLFKQEESIQEITQILAGEILDEKGNLEINSAGFPLNRLPARYAILAGGNDRLFYQI